MVRIVSISDCPSSGVSISLIRDTRDLYSAREESQEEPVKDEWIPKRLTFGKNVVVKTTSH